MTKKTAIVIEDQPVIWEYCKLCLEDYCEIKEFCANTAEAERAFHRHQPDLVWLDCYLGEIAEPYYGFQNSGLLLASWIKKHRPETKIFLFTAADDIGIVKAATDLGIEGIGVAAKFIKDAKIVKDAINEVLSGRTWMSPSVVENFELKEFNDLTVFEFAVVCAMMLGKSSGQIADEMDSTRKRVNNSVYRIKEKFQIEGSSREDMLDNLKEHFKSLYNFNDIYQVSDIFTINSLARDLLKPVLKKLSHKDLSRRCLREVLSWN